MDINYHMKIQNAHGTKNKRERELVKVNYQMSKHFEDTFDTEDVLLNGKSFKLMIIHDTDSNVYKKKIKSRHEEKFNLGDYVEWNGQMWLITLIDSDDKTWNRGYMYQCSILLRWQNKKGKIIERWGYSEDFTKYSSGITGNDIINRGDYQYGITLPVDDETKIIKRDKRFPIDIEGVEPPDVYTLTNRKILLTDDRAFNRGGILVWTLSFSEFNKETDKLVELPNGSKVWICNYQFPTLSLSHTDTITDLSAKISGNKDLKLGFPRTYAVTFKDSNRNNINWNTIDYTWNIVSDFSDKFSFKEFDNQLELLVTEESLADSFFTLQVVASGKILDERKIHVIEGW